MFSMLCLKQNDLFSSCNGFQMFLGSLLNRFDGFGLFRLMYSCSRKVRVLSLITLSKLRPMEWIVVVFLSSYSGVSGVDVQALLF